MFPPLPLLYKAALQTAFGTEKKESKTRVVYIFYYIPYMKLFFKEMQNTFFNTSRFIATKILFYKEAWSPYYNGNGTNTTLSKTSN